MIDIWNISISQIKIKVKICFVISDLDFKKELELEKRRQQLQRELSRLEDEEDPARENFTIEKKLKQQLLVFICYLYL